MYRNQKQNTNTKTQSKMITVEIQVIGGGSQFHAVAKEDGEYWFTIGWYSSAKTAARYAAKKMEKMGYKFDPKELERNAK